MAQLVGALERRVRIKFDSAFQNDAPAHHVTRRDVERVLRWPRWADELTAGADPRPPEIVTAWVAPPPLPVSRDPSLLLVVTRDRRSDRRVHDAWRLYLSDVDLRRARSATDVLIAFLDRYGLDVQLGGSTQRLFATCLVPMGATGNCAAHVPNGAGLFVRTLEILTLAPERSEIDVGAVFAVNESAVREDLTRHAWRGSRSRP